MGEAAEEKEVTERPEIREDARYWSDGFQTLRSTVPEINEEAAQFITTVDLIVSRYDHDGNILWSKPDMRCCIGSARGLLIALLEHGFEVRKR